MSTVIMEKNNTTEYLILNYCPAESHFPRLQQPKNKEEEWKTRTFLVDPKRIQTPTLYLPIFLLTSKIQIYDKPVPHRNNPSNTISKAWKPDFLFCLFIIEVLAM
jgi:hypothetical protein